VNIQTPNARNTDPLSSHLAGEEITVSGKRQRQIDYVTRMVEQHEGHTSAELAKMHGVDRYMVARRLPGSLAVKKGEPKRCDVSCRSAVTWWVK